MLGPENPILSELVSRRLASVDKGEVLDVRFSEFDGVAYHVVGKADAPTQLTVSIALPTDPSSGEPVGPLPEGALDAVGGAYGALAKVVETEVGYTLSLEVDIAGLPADVEERAQAVTRLASVRAVLAGAPLRAVLVRLGGGEASVGPLVPLAHRPGEAFFVKPEADNVAIVHPMQFKDPSDATIATAFLQEFAEARRAPGLSTAPTVAFSKVPPPELEGADPALAAAANAGYITFVLNQRHVEADRLDAVVWSMSTFHAFISYHIKCSKAFMHSSMRKRAASLLAVLSRAKPDVEKEKKTAQGRTFVRPT